MAQPGEFFPQQFAQTILQLNQQKQQRDAELVEMRNPRAAQNFLEKERLDLQARGQQMDFLRSGQAQAGQEEAQKARVQLETEKIKLERDGLAVKAFDDFNRYGTAFLPNTSAADISKFRDAYNQKSGDTGGSSVHEFEIPGQGVLLQRVGGPGFEHNALELEKTRQEIEGLKQTRALQLANQKLYEERAETEHTKRLNLTGGVTVRDAEFARSALETYRKIANNQISGATSRGEEERAKAIELNWKQAFDKDEQPKKRITNLEAIADSYTLQVRSGRPAPTATNIEALKRAGVFEDYVGAQVEAQKAERIVGRISAPSGSTSQRDLRLGRAQEGTFDVTESGKLIPVGGSPPSLGSVHDPASDPSAFTKAKQLLNDVTTGKIPRDDPRVQQAAQFLREYIKRTQAAQ